MKYSPLFLKGVYSKKNMPIASKYEVIDGKVQFMGIVKRRSNRPNPVIDHIVSGLGGSDSDQTKEIETSGFVTLRIPSGEDPESKRPVDIGLNGHNYRLYRDTSATVPKEIAEILINAEKSVSIMPQAQGERIVCQVNPDTGTYIPGKEPTVVENRRFNLEIEGVE